MESGGNINAAQRCINTRRECDSHGFSRLEGGRGKRKEKERFSFLSFFFFPLLFLSLTMQPFLKTFDGLTFSSSSRDNP